MFRAQATLDEDRDDAEAAARAIRAIIAEIPAVDPSVPGRVIDVCHGRLSHPFRAETKAAAVPRNKSNDSKTHILPGDLEDHDLAHAMAHSRTTRSRDVPAFTASAGPPGSADARPPWPPPRARRRAFEGRRESPSLP